MTTLLIYDIVFLFLIYSLKYKPHIWEICHYGNIMKAANKIFV